MRVSMYRKKFIHSLTPNLCRYYTTSLINFLIYCSPYHTPCLAARYDSLLHNLLITSCELNNKSSAVAEMGDHGQNRHGPKRVGGGLLCPFCEGELVYHNVAWTEVYFRGVVIDLPIWAQ